KRPPLSSHTQTAAPPVPPSNQALHYPAYRLFLAGRFLATIGMMMQSVAIGWQVFDLTHDAMALGLVGLAQFLPMAALTLPAGDVADRHDRKLVLVIAYLVIAASSAMLLMASLLHIQAAWPFYAALVVFGAARAFAGPASGSLLTRLVPAEALANATALSSSS